MGTRQSLIDIALKAFLERGYNAVPLKEIADAAGIKQASIYYHFQDKYALLEACAQYFFEKWFEWMEDNLRTDVDLKILLQEIIASLGIDSLIVKRLYDANTETGQYRFILDILTHCPQHMAQMDAFNQAFHALLTEKIDEAKQNGVLSTDVSPQSVYILVSALMEGSNILHFTDPQIDFKKESIQLFKLLWEGLCNAR